MSQILSILYEAALSLPSTEKQKTVTGRTDPFYTRLCELTTTQEADEIWFAAVEQGAADSEASFCRGFAMGQLLLQELQSVPLTR